MLLLHNNGEASLRYQGSMMSMACFRIGILGVGCILCAAPAFAQGTMSGSKPVTGVAAPKPKEEPPPALPGSRAEPTAVAPASRPALDMPPTDALFDAINRGDLAAAKDALNRGADLNGHNVLGMTPLDLAIDLGRNEITFVLLSLRGTESPAADSAPVATAAAKPRTPLQGAAHLSSRHAREREQAEGRVMVRSAKYSSAERRTAPAAQPKLFAGDGGTPNPQVGFLGFSSVR